MEIITSRKNNTISRFRALALYSDYRREEGEYICGGMKMLEDALLSGAEVTTVISSVNFTLDLPPSVPHYRVPDELLSYIMPLKNSPGPVFSVKIPLVTTDTAVKTAIILDTVQDPGNVGTVIRTANAFDIDLVVLTGKCADLYNPKTVRATMGAIFRQSVRELPYDRIGPFLKKRGLTLYGASLSDGAADIRALKLTMAAVAIGSEGKGLSERMQGICDHQITIPMNPDSESLNAAVAAAIIMWELVR